jgi:hypothetical protein
MDVENWHDATGSSYGYDCDWFVRDTYEFEDNGAYNANFGTRQILHAVFVVVV